MGSARARTSASYFPSAQGILSMQMKNADTQEMPFLRVLLHSPCLFHCFYLVAVSSLSLYRYST
jgi:hypothetical protein